jgi:hypothetical protein
VRVFRNARPCDGNTCGQAAVATVLAYFGVEPWSRPGITDGDAIDRVSEEFGPDVPFGLGTSAPRVAAALRHFGLEVELVHSGIVGKRVRSSLRALEGYLSRGIPVPVCIDDGLLGGRPWAAHWAVATAIGDARVTLGNAGDERLALDRFLASWRCRHLPWPHHHCAVLAIR